MNPNDRIFTWARYFAPFVIGAIGTMIGGYTSYQVTNVKLDERMKRNDQRLDSLEQRVGAIDAGQSAVLARIAALDAKVDILLDAYKR